MPALSDKKGFTLIELVVALGIISAVFGVIISSASAIQRSGRNTQRQADLQSIQGALERYFADQHFYPCSPSVDCPPAAKPLVLTSSADITNETGNPNSASSQKFYLTTIPADPLLSTTRPYCYSAAASSADSVCDNSASSANNCGYYVLTAQLEDNSLSDSFSCGGQNYNYALNPYGIIRP